MGGMDKKEVHEPEQRDSGWTPKERFRSKIAIGFVIILICMMAYLTFVPVPAENRDPILMFVSSFLTGGAMAMTMLFGGQDEDKKKCEDKIQKLKMDLAMTQTHYEKELAKVQTAYELLDKKYTVLTDQLIDLHVIDRNGMVLYSKKRET